MRYKTLEAKDKPGPYKYELLDITRVTLSQTFPTTHDDWVRTDAGPAVAFSRGYRWDGASGPTIDTPDSMLASLVHDGLYQLMRNRKLDIGLRKAADKEFVRLLKEAGMPWWRRGYWYAAVRLAGGRRIRKAWK